ncbi:MAG TPA: AAA family ATPase [Methylomirabilota bacterium]
MVYTAHFGLREAPFRATPDPRFLYSNPVYREAYATLLYGVLQRKGFIALTGEVGTGKTTLLRRLMDQLGASVRFVLFYNTTLSFDETVEFICAELELPVDGLSRVQRLQRLNDLLIAEARQGRNVVLLIDEAQNLGPDVLENLRLISNLETSTEKLLQIVLVGQPELDAKLADPALRQVAQRIAVRSRLEPLPDDEIERFIDHRLRQCGRTCRAIFTAEAVERVTACSNGVPRLINILCDGALLTAYGAGMRRVTGSIVDEVASMLKLPGRGETAGHRPTATAPGGALHRRGRTAAPARAVAWVAASLAAVAVVGSAAALLPGPLLTALLGDVPRILPAAPGGGPSPIARPPATARPAVPPGAAVEPASASPPIELLSEGCGDGWRSRP